MKRCVEFQVKWRDTPFSSTPISVDEGQSDGSPSIEISFGVAALDTPNKIGEIMSKINPSATRELWFELSAITSGVTSTILFSHKKNHSITEDGINTGTIGLGYSDGRGGVYGCRISFSGSRI